MPVSEVGTSTATYSAAPTKPGEQPKPAATALSSATSDQRPSTIVTLSDGTSSDVSVYSGKLSSMPMSVAAAPELFVQGDADHDNSLTLEEFTKQLARVGISSDASAQLFESLNVSKNEKLSLDDFVNGVVATNAKGNSVFQDLYVLYTSDQDGKFSPEAYDSFMSQGASVASQYWLQHPELQQRS